MERLLLQRANVAQDLLVRLVHVALLDHFHGLGARVKVAVDEVNRLQREEGREVLNGIGI